MPTGQLTGLYMAVLATYSDFPTEEIFRHRMSDRRENVLALRSQLSKGSSSFHRYAINLLLSKVILPLWCAGPEERRLVQFPHMAENASQVDVSQRGHPLLAQRQLSVPLPYRRDHFSTGALDLLKYASFFVDTDHAVRYLLDMRSFVYQQPYEGNWFYPDPVDCLRQWRGEACRQSMRDTSCGCDVCCDREDFGLLAHNGVENGPPLSLVISSRRVLFSQRPADLSPKVIIIRPGLVTKVPSQLFWSLLHYYLLADRLHRADCLARNGVAKRARKPGQDWTVSRSKPKSLNGNQIGLTCDHVPVSKTCAEVCDGCWPHWRRRRRGGACYWAFEQNERLKEAIRLLNFFGCVEGRQGAGGQVSWQLRVASEPNKVTCLSSQDSRWPSVVSRWLGAQNRLDSLAEICLRFEQKEQEELAETGSSSPDLNELLCIRAQGGEYRFNLINKNRVMAFAVNVPYLQLYLCSAGAKLNNMCGSFVKEVHSFRSSLDSCTFSRYGSLPDNGSKGCLVFNANTDGHTYYDMLHSIALCLDKLARPAMTFQLPHCVPRRIQRGHPSVSNSCHTLDIHGLLNQATYRQHYRKLFNDQTLKCGKRAKPLTCFPAFRVPHSVAVAPNADGEDLVQLDVQYHKSSINISKLYGRQLRRMMVTDLTELLNCRRDEKQYVCILSAKLNRLKWHQEFTARHMLTKLHHLLIELCFFRGSSRLVSLCAFSRDNFAHAGSFCRDKTAGIYNIEEETRARIGPRRSVDLSLLLYISRLLPDVDLGIYGKYCESDRGHSRRKVIPWNPPGRSSCLLTWLSFPPAYCFSRKRMMRLIYRMYRRLGCRDVDGAFECLYFFYKGKPLRDRAGGKR